MKNIFCIFYLIAFTYAAFAQQYVWQQKTSIPSLGRHAPIGFAINGMAYFGMGQDSNHTGYNDLWEYDPVLNSWSQKASLPTSGRVGAGSFAIGLNGFICCGWTNTYNPVQLNDTWKYNSSLNQWMQVASFPGLGRYTPSVFVIGNNAYLGMGYSPFYNDFYEYNSVNDTWTSKANYPITLQSCASFTLNGKGFVVGGHNSTVNNSVYEYDPVADTWTQKNNFPVAPGGAFSFVINNIPYVGMGIVQLNPNIIVTSNVYQYNYILDTWSLVSNFPALPRSSSRGITINNDGYIFGGNNQTSGTIRPIDELWEFAPNVTGLNEYEKDDVKIFVDNKTMQLFVKQNGYKKWNLKIFDVTEKILENFQSNTFNKTFFLNPQVFKSGVYVFSFSYQDSYQIKNGKFVLN